MRKFLASLLVSVFALLAFSVSSVSAKVLSSKNGDVIVPKTEVVNDDLFIGAQNAVIDGTVNGDVFIGVQTVKVTGTVNGNLHVGTQTLDLSGKVSGNVYAGAQSIVLNGSKIGGSLLVGAATVTADKDSVVGGSFLAGAGMLSIDSQVKRNVYAGSGNLIIGADTRIGKNLYYASGKNQGQADISPNAKIAGAVFKSEVNQPQADAQVEAAKKQLPAFLAGLKVFTTVTSFLGALIIGFIYLKLFRKHFTETVNLVSCCFWKSFGVGFLVTIALIPGLIILLVTVIGIPVAGIALLVFALYSYLAKIVVGSAFGNYLSQKFNWKMSTYWAFALGLFVIFVLELIPVIGGLTGLVVFWCGLGALTLKMFSKSEQSS